MARILLVDDDDSFLYATQKGLIAAGYEVHAARHFADALPPVEHGETFDLLLSDVVMPRSINGFALARMVRLRCPDMKVLYVTGYDIPSTEALGKIIRKPVTIEQIVNEVGMALAS
jgi:CheY-like chemotaxis protein